MARILIADDESGILEWLSEIALGAGHQVTTARDGLAAISIAGRETFDLVVTDISMPNQDGLGLILSMRKSHPDTKIIVFSGQDPSALQDARLLGAHAALVKPVSSKKMLHCISEVLAIGRPEALPAPRLHGPFALRDDVIDGEVAAARPGAFALGGPEGTRAFCVTLVGRADTSLNNRLHLHVGGYGYFSYEYCATPQSAFHTECSLYHQFKPRDNSIHPRRPEGESWT